MSATLLIHCPDKPGLVHDITGFVFAHEGNLIDLQQHIDPDENAFFMRVEWSLKRFLLEKEEIASRLQPLTRRHGMEWQLRFSDQRKRIALFVTKENHCLYDLLARQESGDLPVDIPLIISNHEVLKPVAERFNIPFFLSKVTPETKEQEEKRQLGLLKDHGIDTLVLARYMQILSHQLIEAYPNQILNIHHSFLPAFVGAKPYHQAFARGVKLIGATSHYVTEELDQGPIIHQDVIPISHQHSVRDLIRLGRDLEKNVLAKALLHHVKDEVLVYKNKTIVFG